MTIEPHIKRILFLFSSGVILFGTLLGVVFWLSGMIDKKIENITEKRRQIASREETLLGSAALSRDYALVREHIPRITGALSDAPELFTILADMDARAEQLGNKETITVESQTPTRESFGVSSVSFSAEVSGSYQSIREYLRAIQNAPQFIHVNSLSISLPQQSEKGAESGSRAIIKGKIFLK